VGPNHNVAVKADGTVVAWGDSDRSEAEVPPRLTRVVKAAAGRDVSATLDQDGGVRIWWSALPPSGTLLALPGAAPSAGQRTDAR